MELIRPAVLLGYGFGGPVAGDRLFHGIGSACHTLRVTVGCVYLL